MEVLAKTSGRDLTILLRGELDHHGAHDAMQQIEYTLDAALPLSLTIDFSGVSFMDSSGIAVVLRTQRRMAALGGSLTLADIPPQAGKVFEAAGIARMITIK